MRTIWLTLLMWPLIALPISAQAAPGGSAIIPAASASPATPLAHITLGQATFALNGPWKFRTGDDLGWAAADFDDSAWGTIDLTPPPGSYDPITGNSGFVPGWTTRGFPGYAGYAWYRLRVDIQDNVQRGENGELALKMPENVDDIYQVFVNGRMIGEFGRFEPQGNTLYMTQPRAFSLPADLGNGPMTIAVRMWMSAATPLYDPDTGGMHGAPVLGRASVVQALLRLDWDVLDRANESDFLEIWILLTAMLVALALFWMDRDEKAYLVLALTCISLAVYPFLIVCGYYTTWINSTAEVLLRDLIPGPLAMGLWVLFWAYWFRLNRTGHIARVHRTVWTLVALLLLGTCMLRAPLYGSVVPIHAIVWLSPITLMLKLLLGALLLWVTYEGIRRDPTEGWLALPVVLLVIVSLYQSELLVLLVPVFFFPFGFAIDISQIAIVLSLGIITVLLLRRFLRSQREREQWKLDIKQAQEVQQVLIPDELPHVPGLMIESEYRPARQVGGDFFQILPAPDGWQRADCCGRCDGPWTAGRDAGGADCGSNPKPDGHQFRSDEHDAVIESPTLRSRSCACNLPGATHCRGWFGDSGKCRTLAAVFEWERVAHGRRAAAGHGGERGVFLDAFSNGAGGSAVVDFGWSGGGAGRQGPAVRIRAHRGIAAEVNHCGGSCGGRTKLRPGR